MQGVQVWTLVRELGSHMPNGQKKTKTKTKQNIKQKQYCNKFNEDLKKFWVDIFLFFLAL